MRRTATTKLCVVCQKEFYSTTIGRKFCSQACMGASYRLPRACSVCGTEFWFPSSPRHKTCSPACAIASRVEKRRAQSIGPEQRQRISQTLRNQHEARAAGLLPARSTRCARPGCQNVPTGQASKYCSPRCHYDDRTRAGAGRRAQAYHRCQTCGEVFAWNGLGKGAFCSRLCKDKRSGAGPVDIEVVEIVQLRGHRRADFKDDIECCRACGCRAAHTHHVIYRQHIERLKGDRWHPDDALALCVACHGQAHAHRLPLSALRTENLAFAVDLLGAYAVDYLRRYYHDDGDPRITALEPARKAA